MIRVGALPMREHDGCKEMTVVPGPCTQLAYRDGVTVVVVADDVTAWQPNRYSPAAGTARFFLPANIALPCLCQR